MTVVTLRCATRIRVTMPRVVLDGFVELSKGKVHLKYWAACRIPTRARASSGLASLVILATTRAISGLVLNDTQSKTPTSRRMGVCSRGSYPSCSGGCLTCAFCACTGTCGLSEKCSGTPGVLRSLRRSGSNIS